MGRSTSSALLVPSTSVEPSLYRALTTSPSPHNSEMLATAASRLPPLVLRTSKIRPVAPLLVS